MGTRVCEGDGMCRLRAVLILGFGKGSKRVTVRRSELKNPMAMD